MRYFILIFSFLLIFSANAHAFKCVKCHKDEKSVDKFIQERGIKSKDELLNILRNGKMSKIHKNLSDSEIEEAAKILELK